jgi:GNAT superfamily N-acetyltransferase
VRPPNPWIGIPIGVAAAGGATVGFFVTSASCAPQSCLVPAVAVGIAVALVAAAGVGVVLILALRSLAEFRDARDRDILVFVDDPASGRPSHTDAPAVPVITEADDSHVPAVVDFLWAAWREAGPGAPGWAGASEEVIAELADPVAVRERIGGPDRRMFVALDGDRVIGLAGTRRIDHTSVELAGIVVLQSMLGTGVGTPLLEMAVAALAAEGYHRLVVSTERTNDRALGFYASRGFVEIESRTEEVGGAPLELTTLERVIASGE